MRARILGVFFECKDRCIARRFYRANVTYKCDLCITGNRRRRQEYTNIFARHFSDEINRVHIFFGKYFAAEKCARKIVREKLGIELNRAFPGFLTQILTTGSPNYPILIAPNFRSDATKNH